MKILIILIFLIEFHFGSGNVNIKWGQITSKVPEDETENPCNYVAPPKPDFSGPGRRISEVECYGYIWEIKRREEDLVKSVECAEWIRKSCRVQIPFGYKSTETSQFPHMGAVGWRATVGTWVFKCGSTLISSKFLLTAADCSKLPASDTSVVNSEPEIVRLGVKNIADFTGESFPQDVKIKRIIKHPNYMPPKKYFDIAIIEVMTEIQFTKLIQPACLWSKFDTSALGRKATLTGWGLVKTAGKTISPELQAADVDIIDLKKCQQLRLSFFKRQFWKLKTNHICAEKVAGGEDACQGDSGGPLQVKIPLPVTTQGSIHYIIGVTSLNFGCAKPVPGIYTRVSSFVDWIEDVVWKGLK